MGHVKVVREDPPSPQYGQQRTKGMMQVALEKVPHDGEWYRIKTGKPKSIRVDRTQIKQGRFSGVNGLADEFEFTSRAVNGTGRLYTRYVGKPKGKAKAKGKG